MTPLELELLLQCFYFAEPLKLPSDMHAKALAKLIESKVVETNPMKIGTYRTTPLGTAWVEEILETPMPKLQYVGASGKVYEA